MKRICIVWGFLLIFSFSCSSKDEIKSECIEMNNIGIKYLTDAQLGNSVKENIDSAIFYFNKSIKCDSTNYYAYFNLLSAYIAEKDFETSINMIEKMAIKFKEEEHGFDQMKASLYESVGQLDSAIKYYNSSYLHYSDLAIAFPDSPLIAFSKAIAACKIFGKDEATSILDAYINSHPNDTGAKMNKEMFLDLISNKDPSTITIMR